VFRLTGKGAAELLEAGSDRAAKGGRTFAHGSRPIDGRAYLSHRRTLQRARQGNPDPLAVEESGLAFLRLITNTRSSETRRQSGDRRYVDRARDIIARDFRRPLRLSSIAHAAGCSPFHLSRLFRSLTGMSLYRAVLVLRLREAFERLLDEDSTLSNIALEVGFASHSHLTDAFRAEYGCPPSEARAYISSIGRTSLSPSKLGQ
jgi:AraC-like DNA-binding protein